MTARTGPPSHGELVEQIRRLVEGALREGLPPPGRPTLVQKTGANDYQVRMALAVVKSDRRRRRETVGRRGDGPTEQLVTAGDVVTSTSTVDSASRADFASAGEILSAGEPGDAGVASPGDPDVTSAGDFATTVERQAATSPLAKSARRPVSSGASTSTRLVAWGGFLLGLIASVLANMLDAWLPAAHQPPGWTPGLAPQVGGAFWPTALMFAVEALSRVPWPHGRWWVLARYGGVGTVALGSAAISYGHVHDVLVSWGYSTPSATLGPLVIDGLMVICGFALLAISQTKGEEPEYSGGKGGTVP